LLPDHASNKGHSSKRILYDVELFLYKSERYTGSLSCRIHILNNLIKDTNLDSRLPAALKKYTARTVAYVSQILSPDKKRGRHTDAEASLDSLKDIYSVYSKKVPSAYWFYLAKIKYRHKKYDESESHALKYNEITEYKGKYSKEASDIWILSSTNSKDKS